MTLSRRSPLPTDRFRHRASTAFIRAAVATVLANITNGFPGHVAKAAWPGDIDIPLLLRAATSPATTSSSNWAGSLASTAVADFISVMGGSSAAAALLAYGTQLEFEDRIGILVPGMVADPNNIGFVGEAQPIGVRALALDGPTLTPHKLPVIAVFTRELFQRSIPSVEPIARAVLMESIGLALDAAMFSAAAASSIRPAGLLNGITPLTPTDLGGTHDHQDAMDQDLKALIAAVAPVAANGEVLVIAAPAQAVALKLRQSREVFPVLASSALVPGTVIAVAAEGLASAVGATPRFEIASEGTLVMDDAPAALSSVGTPNSVAAPARSLFQTDSVALRVVLEISFALRSPSAISWLQNAVW